MKDVLRQLNTFSIRYTLQRIYTYIIIYSVSIGVEDDVIYK